jgi:5-methylcytosine-specific restriction endonuclease McrA
MSKYTKRFSPEIEEAVYKEQNGLCCNPNCRKPINLNFDRPDHILSQSKTNLRVYGEELIRSKANCQIPCFHCHANKYLWSREKMDELEKLWEPFSKSKLKRVAI